MKVHDVYKKLFALVTVEAFVIVRAGFQCVDMEFCNILAGESATVRYGEQVVGFLYETQIWNLGRTGKPSLHFYASCLIRVSEP